MWPFKKPTIFVECRLPDVHREDQDYIFLGLIDDLDDDYGSCYEIKVKPSDINKVEIIEGRKNKTLEERAIRINIYRRINNLK